MDNFERLLARMRNLRTYTDHFHDRKQAIEDITHVLERDYSHTEIFLAYCAVSVLDGNPNPR